MNTRSATLLSAGLAGLPGPGEMLGWVRAGKGMDESDADLLAATVRGDAEASGRFYCRHERRVLSYAIAR